MTPYYSDPWLTVWQGDCREVMAAMEPESVHCVVTSPPYWGLRDYGTATWLGGDDGCSHLAPVRRGSGTYSTTSTLGPKQDGLGPDNSAWHVTEQQFGHTCGKCGAVRQDSQLGLEPTPEEYVTNMVAVFREVRRVLRADGTVWLNLGDSYAGGGGYSPDSPSNRAGSKQSTNAGSKKGMGVADWGLRMGLKPKDLVGIPWRVAFALQADGWYLRSDIIWAKPNPMPESVTDRPTKAHEYLFLLSKSPRYYYDADAVREPADPSTQRTTNAPNARDVGDGIGMKYSAFEKARYPVSARNLRSVWSIATQPYPGAHFATFPEALVEPCVKAGTSERGVCPECGTPWVREVSREFVKTRGDSHPTGHVDGAGYDAGSNLTHPLGYGRYDVTTTGWQRSCAHDAATVPATVLDPFAGSGTTGRVAQRLGRRAVLIDLSGEYLTQAMRRNQDIPLGLESA